MRRRNKKDGSLKTPKDKGKEIQRKQNSKLDVKRFKMPKPRDRERKSFLTMKQLGKPSVSSLNKNKKYKSRMANSKD